MSDIDRCVEKLMQAMRDRHAAKAARSATWRARHPKDRKQVGGKVRGQKCGAKTRRGTACIRTPLANGRCPNHGGLSTGPKTAAGRMRIAEAQRLRWALVRSTSHSPPSV